MIYHEYIQVKLLTKVYMYGMSVLIESLPNNTYIMYKNGKIWQKHNTELHTPATFNSNIALITEISLDLKQAPKYNRWQIQLVYI